MSFEADAKANAKRGKKRAKASLGDDGGRKKKGKAKAEERVDRRAPLPVRNKKRELVFEGHPEFRPNLTPKQIMQMGSFGGTYFRPIKSSVTNKSYTKAWEEFPEDWFEGLNITTQVASRTYEKALNKFGVKCGGSLDMWESSGWIVEQDPYGWFQWYCRFYLGRRTDDDDRQIGRGNRAIGLLSTSPLFFQSAGPTGRFRTQLMNKVIKNNTTYNDPSVSPVIRQTLQHWGYELTEEDFIMYLKQKGFDGS
ncbi:unnamed protein product [Chrysoparadoxa australica]